MSSRSNSANAAKMPNTGQPPAVVVSICAPSPRARAGRHLGPTGPAPCRPGARGCGPAGQASRRRARRRLAGRAGMPPSRGALPSLLRLGPRRADRVRPHRRGGRRAAGRATGSRPPWRRGPSRPACLFLKRWFEKRHPLAPHRVNSTDQNWFRKLSYANLRSPKCGTLPGPARHALSGPTHSLRSFPLALSAASRPGIPAHPAELPPAIAQRVPNPSRPSVRQVHRGVHGKRTTTRR